jgi:ferredoxin-type protein NapG
MPSGDGQSRQQSKSLGVPKDRVTRRDLLRGRLADPKPKGHLGAVVKPGEKLPDVISWLDPEMKATPRKGETDSTFVLLRPPGAVAESDFLEACTRCGDCAEVCPHDAIREAPARLREAQGTPIIDPHASPCQMCEDLPCISACETGALRSEAPAALGAARVSPLDCLNRLSATCSVCVERCPVPGAIDFVADVPEVNERLCTGCGICQHVCPAPQNAILMLPNADRPTSRALDLSGGGPTEIELPELTEAELDDDALCTLFRDLGAAAEIDDIRCKQAPDRRAGASRISLEEALAWLLEGRVRGAQVRYRYDGKAWCDTILATPTGHRVVRIEAPTSPSGLVS